MYISLATQLAHKMIPIKGYATFDPLKHCLIGSSFQPEWFKDLDIYKNDKIMDPLKRIAEETEQDYQILERILKGAGVKTYRSFIDIDKVKSLKNIQRPPVCPRDIFAVVGETMYAPGIGSMGFRAGYDDILKQIDRKNIEFVGGVTGDSKDNLINTAEMCRVGKDIWWDNVYHSYGTDRTNDFISKYVNKWTDEGFRVHLSNRGYHSDGSFCVVRPGCIVSLEDIQDYSKEFPGWDVLYLPDQHWSKLSPFKKMKQKVGGRWWLKGEEHNDELINFVDTWLRDWVGYVEETVFDINMLSLDPNTIICNKYNKDVFDHFKKHKVEPVIFNFRHRYFWDGGVHCITQDLYREGTQEDYFA